MNAACRRLATTSAHMEAGLAPFAAAAAATSRQIIIAEVPRGPLEASHFALEDAELAPLAQSKVRVQVQALTIGAGQRAGLQGSAGYAGAVKGESNAVMSGSGFGVVAESNDPAFAVGDSVMGPTGWRASNQGATDGGFRGFS